MELLVSRLQELHYGYDLSLSDGEEIRTIATIDGNRPGRPEPVVLLTLDPYTLFGLSHPEVVARLLNSGPQVLVSLRTTAHKLFEHGMKAAWERITLGSNQFLTSLATFYKQADQAQYLEVYGTDTDRPACLVSVPSYEPVWLVYGGSKPGPVMQHAHTVRLDQIRGTTTYKLRPIPVM